MSASVKTGKKKSARKAVIWIVVIVVVAAALAGWAVLRKRAGSYQEFTARTADLSTWYSFSGNVEARNKQTVYADKVMQIVEIKVAAGDAVKAGDVLMVTSAGDSIVAKIDGTVAKIYPESGAPVLSGAKLADITDYSALQLKVQVDEYDLPAVKVGKAATVTIHALDKEVPGTVTDVSREGVYAAGVTYFNAVISLDPALLVGLSAEARILNESVTGAVLLSVDAIRFASDNTPYITRYVNASRKSATEDVPVTLGVNDGVNVQVVSGVASGDVVLVPQTSNAAVFQRNNVRATAGSFSQ